MEKKSMSEARRRANKKWNDANMNVKYDHLHVVIPKGRKADVEARAVTAGASLNGYINDLLRGDAGMTEEEWKATKE